MFTSALHDAALAFWYAIAIYAKVAIHCVLDLTAQ